MQSSFAIKLDFCIEKIDICAQKIDGSSLKTYEIVITMFEIDI